jgi:hypothetical protein
MATITGSVAGLVTFGSSVTGVNASYDLKTFFEAVAATPSTLQLPCLLVVPALDEQVGWRPLAQQGQSPVAEFVLDHYLLYSKIANNQDFAALQMTVLGFVDNYHAALKANPFYSNPPATHTTPKVHYRMVKSTWAGVSYHSIIFRSEMGLYL